MTKPESRVALLRRRAVESLANTKFPIEAEQLLERLAAVALEGSDDALFAHHELATLQLERSPWNAALHLRKVIAGRPNDAAAHALMGLCQALLSNFRVAVSSYERAIALDPNVAEYHHNVGHFLDVAMGSTHKALGYLERAHELAPGNHEITASLAHSLARAGRLKEAEALAEAVAQHAPDDPSRQNLLAWIREGAPAESSLASSASTAGEAGASPSSRRARHSRGSAKSPGPSKLEPASAWNAVLLGLRAHAQDAPAALELAASFAAAGKEWTNSSAMAGAIDYLSGSGESQRVVASRHDVGVSALARRVAAVRTVLRSQP